MQKPKISLQLTPNLSLLRVGFCYDNLNLSPMFFLDFLTFLLFFFIFETQFFYYIFLTFRKQGLLHE
ncbi:hypothetical protein BHE82_00995 [Rice orange leaf phytoplasma]|nr:hypothetical protein BHE82_00995 [Rice orange leaf phytoplasma]